ncbi:TPA: ABC transporter [Candidatus Sumerlaeota bacterium]|jgi:ABC-2 type transport system ATP-binding protein|nr:ABC transporter [Candidatus Sumerlaeota bacterium]
MSNETVLQVENLVVEYSSKEGAVRAVNGVSFEVRAGECVGFIGPNGAGKSSTMKALMGFLFPASGKVSVFGKPAGEVESKLRIGYLPEVTLYYPFLKATELLRLYGGLQRVPRATLDQRIPFLLEEVGLKDVGNKLIRNYSKGMQQRLGIAQALIAEPECLIFDELSSGLDPVGRHDLRRVLVGLKEKGVTLFFSSHELYEVEALCDRVIAINHGKVLFDLSLDALRKEAGDQGLEAYFMSRVQEQDAACVS